MRSGLVGAVGIAKEMGEMPSPRLARAAHEFEGQMLKELLRPMTASGALTGGDGEDDLGEGSGSAMSEFASEALGQALSAQGGFGIANRIVRELTGSGCRDKGGEETGSRNANSVMRAFE